MPPPKPLKFLRDRIGPTPRVLFVGINPGIRSAETGHHFAGYSNRFWKLLYDSGLVPERLTFERDVELPCWRFAITNLIARPTPGIGDLRPEEYEAGRRRLLRKIARVRPGIVAFVGVTLFRAVFRESGPRGGWRSRPVHLGLQDETLHGASVFVLPNPSGRNANFSYAEMLEAFVALRRFLEQQTGSRHGTRGSRLRALGSLSEKRPERRPK